MKKSKNIIITISIMLVLVIGILITFLLSSNQKNNKQLQDEEHTIKLENVSSEYVKNDTIVTDENGNVRNYSNNLKIEKFFENKTVGIYDINIVNNDNDESILTYTLKNHSSEKIEPKKYRLQFINYDGSIAGTVDLETQTLGALDKYNVKINLDSDILDIYDINVTTDFEVYGNLGGGNSEA